MQVVARLKSYNAFGWSEMSEDNTGGAVILTEPIQMQPPIYIPLSSDGISVTLNLIELTAYEETGGSPIDSYYVEMSEGNSGVWTAV